MDEERKKAVLESINTIENISKERYKIYSAMEELGIPFKKTNCIKCLMDYLNIVREELGLIESAAENSAFDSGIRYVASRPSSWKGKMIDKETDSETLYSFCKEHPKHCR